MNEPSTRRTASENGSEGAVGANGPEGAFGASGSERTPSAREPEGAPGAKNPSAKSPEVKIGANGYEATVTSVGAMLRTLRYEGRDLVVPVDREVPAAYHGAVLAPWPNRLADGKYKYDGTEYLAAINEPEIGTALHGLACWLDWSLAEAGEDFAEFHVRVPVQPAYPTTLDLAARYELSGDGLTWQVSATNVGHLAAPYGTSIHPYFRAATGNVDDWTLSVPAAKVVEVSERLLPVAEREVASWRDGQFDFTAPRQVGAAKVDHAFTDLRPGSDGMARARLVDAGGRGVELSWLAEALPWVQVFTSDIGKPDFPDRTGIALEPMTCAINAFNSGEGLIRLEPGDTHVARWHVRAI